MPTSRIGQVAVPATIIGIVVMMVVPLPSVVLDLLLVANLSAAVVILLTAMSVERPLDFSIFPSLLLVATMMRLSLNVSATRLVLLHGFAGEVIESFGHFVIGGSIVVGLVIFLILVVIQFVVITNGASRVAEVAARFTLDAMPGKQMAIDADLNAGLIAEDEARSRRREVVARRPTSTAPWTAPSQVRQGRRHRRHHHHDHQPHRRLHRRRHAAGPEPRRGRRRPTACSPSATASCRRSRPC